MYEYFKEYYRILDSLDHQSIEIAAELMEEADLVIFCGNGGSYACASHMAGDILMNTKITGNTICVGDNGVSFSAVANDYSYEEVYLREVEKRLCNFKGKVVLVLLSTSGRSPNIITVGTHAKALGVTNVISMVGDYNELVLPFSDVIIDMNSKDAGFIEAVYEFIGHLFVRLINKSKEY